MKRFWLLVIFMLVVASLNADNIGNIGDGDPATSQSDAGDRILYTRGTSGAADADSLVDSFYVRIHTITGGPYNLTFAIYDDNGSGSPGNLICSTLTSASVSAVGWFAIGGISSHVLTNSTTYYVAVWSNCCTPSALRITYDGGAPAGTQQWDTLYQCDQFNSTPWPNPAGTVSGTITRYPWMYAKLKAAAPASSGVSSKKKKLLQNRGRR